MEKRFKILTYLVLSDSRLDQFTDKIEEVAKAIDSGYPKAKEMLTFLENWVLEYLEEYELAQLN